MFSRLLRFFSRFTDSQEKEIGRFFARLSAKSDKVGSQRQAQIFLQQDVVRVLVWLEYSFKQYKTLKKSYRRELYVNAEKIGRNFLSFWEQQKLNLEKSIQNQPLSQSLQGDEKFVFLWGIMQYLLPGNRFEYLESSAFEKLLRDPTKEVLKGDCNQIVALYIFLYSLKYDINDLKLKILPEHVCLSYCEIDIEATNASFQQYEKYEKILPVYEIISVNLLDISDREEDRFQVSPQSMLDAAEICFVLSSYRELVEKNLRSAYHRLANRYMREHNFAKAESFFRLAGDKALLPSFYVSAVQWFLKNNKFSVAKMYAMKSKDQNLDKIVVQNEAAYWLNKKYFSKAEKMFRQIGDEKGIRASYAGEMRGVLDQLKYCKTVTDYKSKKTQLRRLEFLARKVGDQKMLGFCRDVLKKI